ncbi:MAG: deoxyhypusine synthase [Acidobacteria bacterium]|nr:deoxyhypusine synthase [Acidobacteriota bacterium]
MHGDPIRYYRPRGSAEVRRLVDESFQAFNAGRLSEACHVFADKMLDPANDTTIGLTIAGALTPAGLGGCVIELMERGLVDFIISTGANLYHDLHYALNFTLHRGSPFLDDVQLHEDGVIRIYDILFPAQVLLETDAYVRGFLARQAFDHPISSAALHYALGQDLMSRQPGCEAYSVVASAAATGVPIYTSSPGDSSIGMNLASHALLGGGGCAIDSNRDVNEVAAIILDGTRNGCLILGGGSPKNFYLQGQPTLWEIYGIPKGGNEYFVQITTDQVVWGGLSGATPSEAVSWGKVNPGMLPDTVVAYSDATIAFPILCEYVVGSEHGRRERRGLVHRRDALVAELERQARARPQSSSDV